MNTNIQRQAIIDFIISNKWRIKWNDYQILWLDYVQALYNHLKWLQARGYITKVWKQKYSVIEETYKNEMIVEEVNKELTRLRRIETKYNKICHILQSE